MHNNHYSNTEQSIRVAGRLLMYVFTLLAAVVLLLAILLWVNTGNFVFTKKIFIKEKREKTGAIKEDSTVNAYSEVVGKTP
ncbi:hypothetical protein [Chitinophaga sp. OAE865]|uniref:hypothetical protein n=1 Tax=Chitinophaga sp. OAE865 TaxID=2817898 RepID=UPI001AE61854